MLYIDPKDQYIETLDAVLQKAWHERRELRMRRHNLDREIAALDEFISIYCCRVGPDYKLDLMQTGAVTAEISK